MTARSFDPYDGPEWLQNWCDLNDHSLDVVDEDNMSYYRVIGPQGTGYQVPVGSTLEQFLKYISPEDEDGESING